MEVVVERGAPKEGSEAELASGLRSSDAVESPTIAQSVGSSEL